MAEITLGDVYGAINNIKTNNFVSQVILLNAVTINPGAMVGGDYVEFDQSPFCAYSLSATGGAPHSFDIYEAFFVQKGSTAATKAASSIGSSGGTAIWNSSRLNVVAPRKRWYIKNNDTVAHTYTLTLLLFPS